MAKSYSYEQVTAATEDTVRRLTVIAHSEKSFSPSAKSLARGAVHLWSMLTIGDKREGDQERLDVMVSAIGRDGAQLGITQP